MSIKTDKIEHVRAQMKDWIQLAKDANLDPKGLCPVIILEQEVPDSNSRYLLGLAPTFGHAFDGKKWSTEIRIYSKAIKHFHSPEIYQSNGDYWIKK